MFAVDAKVKLPDTDAAGILFYGNYFKLIHETYESFMDSIDYGLDWVLEKADVLLLIAHAEADYKQSLRLGDTYSLKLKVTNIGRTSFTLSYEFIKGSGESAAVATTVHVAVDKKTKRKIELPDDLRRKLENAAR